MRVFRLASLAWISSGVTAFAADLSVLEAVRTGQHELAIDLLFDGGSATDVGPDGTTALMWAAYQDDEKLVSALINAGADVGARNDYGVSALSEAALLGSQGVIEVLLGAGADPNSTNAEGETALMLVARTGNIRAATRLLDAGADIDAREQWGGQSALMWAAAQSQPAMVELLLARGAEVDARSTVREWQRKVTSEPRPKDMNKGGFTPLLYAARVGCIDCAMHLIEGGADPDLGDPENVSPLNLALENLHFDFAAYMVTAGADVDKFDFRGRSPVYMAVDMNTLPTSARGDIPSGDAMRGADILRMLLEAGANPNIQLKRRHPYRHRALDRRGDIILDVGATPLLRAARACDVEAVELLLRHGALVDLPTAYGVTPLMAAAGIAHNERTTRGRDRNEEDTLATLQRLLDAGADIDARMVTEPVTPREVSAGSQGRDLSYGSRGRQVPSEDATLHWTAMHGAAMKGWDHVVRFLAEHGAELEWRDADGRTPLDLASGYYNADFTRAVGRSEPRLETMALLEGLIRDRDYPAKL